MTNVEINSFDDNAVGKIARSVRRLEKQYRNLRNQLTRKGRETEGFTIRTGITTTNSTHPTYPSGGCKFVVKFEDWTFAETVGNCDFDSRPWPMKFVVARAYHGKYIEEGTRVIIVKIPGKKGRCWWILPIPPKLELIRFQLLANLSFGGSAIATKLNCSLVATEGIIVRDSIGEWHGLTGYQGWAVQLDDCPATVPKTYEIIFLEAPARWIEFTLTANMTAGSAAATVDRYWGLTPNGKSPGPTQTVYDRKNLFRRARTGAKGYAVYDERDTTVSPLGRWIVVECQSKAGFICFTLTQNRQEAGTASAGVNYFWGTQQDVQDPGPSTIVYFCDEHYPHAQSGAKGIAALDSETDQYRVIQCDQMALSCYAEPYASFCPGDLNVTISSYDESTFFPFGQRPESLSAAINLYGCAVDSGGEPLWLEWSEVFLDWIVIQALHVETEVVLGTRYNSCGIENQVQKVAVMRCAQPEWKPAIELFPVQVLESIYKSITLGSSGSGDSQIVACDVGQRKKTICTFDDPEVEEEIVINGIKKKVVEYSEDDGECFVNHNVEIFALCIGATDEVDVFCTNDCAGSGSGPAE